MKYLYYNNYASGRSGLSNGVMSIELGVVLAHLMDRVLVLDGNESPPANVVQYDGIAMDGPRSRVVDLLEIPVPWVDARAIDLSRLPSRELTPHSLMNCAFHHPADLDVATDDFRHFLHTRQHVLCESDEARETAVVRLSGGDSAQPGLRLHNFGFYSYFFYLDAASRRSVHRLLRAMAPRPPWAELAARITGDLGRFNATHIRRGDFKVTYGTTTLERKPADALAVLDANFDRADRLVLLTDEQGDPFFDEIVAAYPDSLFLDELILTAYRDAFLELPRHDSISLAFLAQQVAAGSQDFIGTMTSTFTSLIQRHRGNRGAREDFKFLWNELPDEADEIARGRHRPSDCVPMDRGVMIEEYAGPYSWNRYNPRINPAWQREWPESFLLPETATADGEPPTVVPIARTSPGGREAMGHPQEESPDPKAGAERRVEVEVCLAGGHRFHFALRAGSDLLRRLHAALARGASGARQPELFQIPQEEGHAACTFAASQIVAIVTDPPVLIEGAHRPEASDV